MVRGNNNSAPNYPNYRAPLFDAVRSTTDLHLSACARAHLCGNQMAPAKLQTICTHMYTHVCVCVNACAFDLRAGSAICLCCHSGVACVYMCLRSVRFLFCYSLFGLTHAHTLTHGKNTHQHVDTIDCYARAQPLRTCREHSKLSANRVLFSRTLYIYMCVCVYFDWEITLAQKRRPSHKICARRSPHIHRIHIRCTCVCDNTQHRDLQSHNLLLRHGNIHIL